MTGLKRTSPKDSFYDSEEPIRAVCSKKSTIERIARTDDWFEQAGALLRAAIAPVVTQAAPAPILVRTFGGLSITRGDATVEVKGKARALLVEVLARGGRDVCAKEVAHAMWPHGETEFAMGALNTTLFRARRRYDLKGLLLLEDGRLGLNTELCLVDRWLLESALDSGRRFWNWVTVLIHADYGMHFTLSPPPSRPATGTRSQRSRGRGTRPCPRPHRPGVQAGGRDVPRSGNDSAGLAGAHRCARPVPLDVGRLRDPWLQDFLLQRRPHLATVALVPDKRQRRRAGLYSCACRKVQGGRLERHLRQWWQVA